MEAKKLVVNAIESEHGQERDYQFPVYEFSNGLILVPSETTNDWFFEDRDSIDVCGVGFVTSIEETEKTVNFTAQELIEIIEDSRGEWGEDSVPEKYLELINP